MILIVSSVWIDYFRGTTTTQTEKLDSLLGTEPLATCDLVFTEVLQGFINDQDFIQAKKIMTSLERIEMSGQNIAVQAAKNFRTLRLRGITVRKTIDTIIATGCIENEVLLLYSDKDFDPFVKHLGLRSAMPKR